MMGISHALTGLVAAAVVAQVIDTTWPDMVVGAVVVVGATMVPDIDHENATITKTLGPLTRGLSWVVRKLTGGHRRGTHSVAGAAALAGVVQLAVDQRGSPWSTAVLSLVLCLCLAGPLRLLRIRGWLDDVLPIPLAIGAVLWPPVPLTLMAPMIFTGMIVHVLGDMITKQGCPIWWPLSDRRHRLATLTAGGRMERWILRPMFVISIPVIVCWDWVSPYVEAVRTNLAG